VTLPWWTQLWLNEGFATYFENVGAGAFWSSGSIPPGSLSYMHAFGVDVLESALRFDAGNSSYAMAQADEVVNSEVLAESLFGRVVYEKGGAVLRMLHAYLVGATEQQGAPVPPSWQVRRLLDDASDAAKDRLEVSHGADSDKADVSVERSDADAGEKDTLGGAVERWKGKDLDVVGGNERAENDEQDISWGKEAGQLLQRQRGVDRVDRVARGAAVDHSKAENEKEMAAQSKGTAGLGVDFDPIVLALSTEQAQQTPALWKSTLAAGHAKGSGKRGWMRERMEINGKLAWKAWFGEFSESSRMRQLLNEGSEGKNEGDEGEGEGQAEGQGGGIAESPRQIPEDGPPPEGATGVPRVSQDAFFSGLASYLQGRQFGAGDTDGLWETLENATGTLFFAAKMSTWTHQQGVPLLEASLNGDTLNLTQRQLRLVGLEPLECSGGGAAMNALPLPLPGPGDANTLGGVVSLCVIINNQCIVISALSILYN
jgi:hypothetical protein